MLRLVILIFFCGSFVALINGQQMAVTETGEEVLLYDDGTWTYKNMENGMDSFKEIQMNPAIFTKEDNASFHLKSTKTKLGIWLDPKKWSFKKASENPEAEYEFQLKNGDLYGMLISEKFEIPLANLRTIAIENGKAAAPDLKVVHEEYRMVNGLKVLQLQMNGTMQGIKFSYYGYYYSDESGTAH